MHEAWEWIVETDWGEIGNVTLGFVFLGMVLAIFPLILSRIWRQWRRQRDLRRRFHDVFRSPLVLPGERGFEECVRFTNAIVASTRSCMTMSQATLAVLRKSRRPTRDGMVWADVEREERLATELAVRMQAMEALAKEAGIPLTEAR